jgi:hypothetical protein
VLVAMSLIHAVFLGIQLEMRECESESVRMSESERNEIASDVDYDEELSAGCDEPYPCGFFFRYPNRDERGEERERESERYDIVSDVDYDEEMSAGCDEYLCNFLGIQ